jgi:hypothetical protein
VIGPSTGSMCRCPDGIIAARGSRRWRIRAGLGCRIVEDMARRWELVLLGVVGCGSVESGGGEADARPQEAIDAAGVIDGGQTPMCAHGDPFETIDPVPGVNTAADEHNPWLSPDERTIVFTRWPIGGNVGNFFIATRDSADGDFAEADPVSVNSAQDEWRAWLSADLRTIYFDRGPISGDYDILFATRSSPSGDFGAAMEIPNVTDPEASEFDPFVTPDGLYFGKKVDGNIQLWFAPAEGAGFGQAALVSGANSAAPDEMPVVSADGAAVYFGADGRGAEGASWDVWLLPLAAPGQGADQPVRLDAPINTATREYPSWLSPDNCRLYFTTDADGDHDLWVATRTPPG